MTDMKQDLVFAAATTQIVPMALVNLDGTPFDLTNQTAIRFRACPFPSGDAVVQKDTTNGIGITGVPTDGTITVSIANTDLTIPGLYSWDVVVTVAGVDTRCKFGRIVVANSPSAPGA